MEENEVLRALAALSHVSRLRVFRSLVVAGPQGLTPGELVDALDVPATGLSFHLKGLAHADLVSQERRGRNLVYRANFDRMNGLLGYLTENCCDGDAGGIAVAPVCCR